MSRLPYRCTEASPDKNLQNRIRSCFPLESAFGLRWAFVLDAPSCVPRQWRDVESRSCRERNPIFEGRLLPELLGERDEAALRAKYVSSGLGLCYISSCSLL